MSENNPDNVIPFRKRMADADKAERRTINKARRRITARQSIGKDWDGVAANDNMSWPLAKALLAEKNHDLLKWAIRYRQIEASATSGALLKGNSLSPDEMMAIDQRTWIRPDGSIAYKGVRKLTAAQFSDEPATQAVRTTPSTRARTRPVPRQWTGDNAVNDMIDNRNLIFSLRAGLGPIVEPFEMAVCEGATMEQVGRSMGVGNSVQASGAAKALVILGLITIRDALSGRRAHAA